MTVDDRLRWFDDRERALWLWAIALYVVGDTATTYAGLSTGGVAEAGPVAGPLMDVAGRGALLVIKLLTLALFFVAWRFLRSPTRTAIPLALVVVGAAVTGWNVFVILVALG